jgi:hypothetical protein
MQLHQVTGAARCVLVLGAPTRVGLHIQSIMMTFFLVPSQSETYEYASK